MSRFIISSSSLLAEICTLDSGTSDLATTCGIAIIVGTLVFWFTDLQQFADQVTGCRPVDRI